MSNGDDLGPQAHSRDDWDQWEADASTLLDQLRDDADDWDVLAVDVAGEADDGDVLFLLVIRRKVKDGNLLLSEAYYRWDVLDRSGSWVGNSIERRVSGTLAKALKVLYASVADGNATPDDPMLLDSRNGGGLDLDADVLQQPTRELRDGPDADDLDGRDPGLRESREGRTTSTVECNNCGQEADRQECINIGAGIGVDVWVHEDRCPQGGDDEQ